MKWIFFATFLIASLAGNAQTYHTDSIKVKTDSALLSTVGEHLFSFYEIESSAQYHYKNEKDKSVYDTLFSSNQTKGFFKGSTVWYYLRHPDYECILASMGFDVDSLLNVSVYSNGSEKLPDFFKTGDEPTFLSRKAAEKIFKGIGYEKGIEAPNMCIKWDRFNHEFRWQLNNYLSEDHNSYNHYGEVEIIDIGASDGQLRTHHTTTYQYKMY